MSTSPQLAQDWFDRFWEEYKHKLPLLMRGDASKELARGLMTVAIQSAAKQAATPQGVRALIAYSRIAAIVKGTKGVCDAPDPTPDEVAEAVERLLQRVKP